MLHWERGVSVLEVVCLFPDRGMALLAIDSRLVQRLSGVIGALLRL